MSADDQQAVQLPVVDEHGNTILITAAPVAVGQAEPGMMEVSHGHQTITVSLDEATQYLLQQQGLGSQSQAIQVQDGTFQFFDHPVIQVQREDGTMETQVLPVEVLQALQGEFVQQLQPAMEDVDYATSHKDADEEVEDLHAAAHREGGKDEETLYVVKAQQDMSEYQGDEPVHDLASSEPALEGADHDYSLERESGNMRGELEEGHVNRADKERNEPGDVSEQERKLPEGNVVGQQQADPGEQAGRDVKSVSQNGESVSNINEAAKAVSRKEVKTEADLANPIPLSEQTVITIKGKKCVLSYDEKTQQVCAYPIKPSGKRRGRPRMTEAEKVAARQKKLQQQMEMAAAKESSLGEAPSEKSSAAETLLELSNTGSGGIRRSGRARRKAKLMDDYEELEDSDTEGPEFEDDQEKDPDIDLDLPDSKRRKLVLPKLTQTPGISHTTFGQPVIKRGRGRPRRYPLPGHQTQTPTSIPALMLPSADGQTLVMAPLQGLQNFQQIRRQLPHIVPKPEVPEEASTETTPSLPITVPTSGEGGDTHNIVLTCSDSDTLPLDATSVLDSSSIISQALQGDSIPLDGDTAEDQGDGLDTSPSSLLNMMATSAGGDASKIKADTTQTEPQGQQPTVIQIPDNLLASLGFKKDPIKIGLKASERELEKLKCPKCDFQGYYVQQYRNHIATHGDDIQKCKCCSFISLDPEELLQHFKEFHPRCICPVCGYMAEHAYIIKRHMMRHDIKSCTCHVCGKVYKDMYILKMHIKMVHMPAEVLFECDICSKKFTRKAHLKRHMRIHEPDKPFKCTLCDYRGSERSDISKHMLVHQEPKHVCERCGKTFRHIKNKELHVKRHYGQRDYKCGVCDFYGYTFTDIRKHIERKHQDIKTMMCDKCGRHFRTESAFKEHRQACNVMMIEQVLAIPTSGGRTNQATIQIPTQHLTGLDGMLALDMANTSGAATQQGVTRVVSTHADREEVSQHAVSLMVAASGDEQQFGLVEAATMEDDEEEEEDEDIKQEVPDETAEGSSVQHAMDTLMDSAIIQEGATDDGHILASSVFSGKVEVGEGNQLISEGHVLDPSGHYINTPAGLQLVTSTAAAGHTVISIEDSGGQHTTDASLNSDSVTGGVVVGEEDVGRASSKPHHLVTVASLDGDSAVEDGNTEILVNMEEWDTSSHQDNLICDGATTST